MLTTLLRVFAVWGNVALGLAIPFMCNVGYRKTAYLPHASRIWSLSALGIELFVCGQLLVLVVDKTHLPFSAVLLLGLASGACEIVGMLTFLWFQLVVRAREEDAYRRGSGSNKG